MKLTPWFHGRIKPVRVGVYQREAGYSFWDGKKWLAYAFSPEEARGVLDVSWWQRDAWRGLAEEPK